MKFKYKSLFFISLLIILSVSIGMVSASSDITVDDVASDDVSTLAIDQVDNNTISGVESSLDDVKDSSASLGSGTGTLLENGNVLSYANDTVLSPDDINGTLTISQSGKYYRAKALTIKLTNSITGNVIHNEKVLLKFSNGKSVTLTTNSKGVATYNFPYAPGTYKVTASPVNKSIIASAKVTFKIYKATSSVISPVKLTTTYGSGKTFNIKVTSKDKKPIVGLKLKIKVYTGKKYKTYYATTGSDGVAKFKASKLSTVKHKVIVSSANKYVTAKAKTSYITIKRKALYLSVIKLHVGSGMYLYCLVASSDKAGNNGIDGIKVQVKIFTGKKYKTYYMTTGFLDGIHGFTGFMTDAFSVGTHKVVIKPVSSIYNRPTVTTKLVITKPMKNFKKVMVYFSKGKMKTIYY